MSDVAVMQDEETAPAAGCMWWLLLGTGIAWILIAFAVLGFDPTSAATIGIMTGLVILFAGITELATAFVAESWRWVRVLVGVLLIIAGFAAFAEPFQTFGILALLIGWYLIVRGTFGIIFSIAARHELPLWGLVLGAGILELLIGVWAVGYPGRSAWLLILWVGLGALIHGVTQIVFAFQVHGAARAQA